MIRVTGSNDDTQAQGRHLLAVDLALFGITQFGTDYSHPFTDGTQMRRGRREKLASCGPPNYR